MFVKLVVSQSLECESSREQGHGSGLTNGVIASQDSALVPERCSEWKGDDRLEDSFGQKCLEQ